MWNTDLIASFFFYQPPFSERISYGNLHTYILLHNISSKRIIFPIPFNIAFSLNESPNLHANASKFNTSRPK